MVSFVKGDLHFDVIGILMRLQKKTPLNGTVYLLRVLLIWFPLLREICILM